MLILMGILNSLQKQPLRSFNSKNTVNKFLFKIGVVWVVGTSSYSRLWKLEASQVILDWQFYLNCYNNTRRGKLKTVLAVCMLMINLDMLVVNRVSEYWISKVTPPIHFYLVTMARPVVESAIWCTLILGCKIQKSVF